MEEMVTTETSAVAAAVPEQPEGVRRGRARAVMLVVGGVMITAAFLLGAIGSEARSKTSDERGDARVATESRQALVHRGVVADRAREDVERAMSALPRAFDALAGALDDNAVAHGHFVDVVDRGADLYNAGDENGARALYQG